MYPKRIGQVYMLVCFNKWNIYFGSTTTSLEKRLSWHKSDYKKYLKGAHEYVTSYVIIKEDNYQIISVEDVYDDEGVTLEERERYYIEKYKDNCVNKKVPGRTRFEYRLDNIDKIKEYRRVNRDRDAVQRSEPYTCECGTAVRKDSKYRHFKTIKHQNYLASLKE